MSATTASSEEGDAEQVLQLLLNAPQLAKYYHFDVRPERLPLRLANASGRDFGAVRLTAGGQPVSVVTGSDRAAIEITALALQGATANVTFSFRPEGVLGEASFKKAGGRWTPESIKVAER